MFDCQVCLALPPSPRWCFPSLRPPSEMWNSKGPLTPAHQAPCVELSSDVTLKSRPHPKYIRQYHQTNIPKAHLWLITPMKPFLICSIWTALIRIKYIKTNLACILTSLFRASRWIVYCQMNTASGIS